MKTAALLLGGVLTGGGTVQLWTVSQPPKECACRYQDVEHRIDRLYELLLRHDDMND